MSKFNIDVMPAGREMDTLMAGVMGWIDAANPYDRSGETREYRKPPGTANDFFRHAIDWKPSTDTTNACEVIEELELHIGPFRSDDSEIVSWYAADRHDWNDGGAIIEVATTLPLAVCRAAYKIAERKAINDQA